MDGEKKNDGEVLDECCAFRFVGRGILVVLLLASVNFWLHR